MVRVIVLVAAALLGTSQPSAGTLLYRFADPRIDEASGIARGLASPGIDYVENDSGGGNSFYAVDDRTGETAATVTVPNADNIDWEDIAVAPDRSGRPSVWLADIGDNAGSRREVEVYRLPEPRIRAADRGRRVRVPAVATWRLRYPDGPVNAESLALAPDGRAYIVTKSALGLSAVYRLPRSPDAHRVQLLTRVGGLTFSPTGTANPFGGPGQLAATSAAISPDGTVFAVRTYADAYFWRVTSGDVAAALRRPPVRIALPRQPQGEGIGLTRNTALLDSEGAHSPVYALALPAWPPASGASSSRQARTAGSASASSTGSSLSSDSTSTGWPAVALAGVGGLLLVLVGAGWRLRRKSGRRGGR